MKFDKDISTFIMLVGIPGSGKSTYAEKLKKTRLAIPLALTDGQRAIIKREVYK